MSATATMNAVIATARELLPHMRDPNTGLYAHKTTLDAEGRYVHSGANSLYTTIALIGALEQAHSGNGTEPDGLGTSLDALYSQWATAGGGASLHGCMLWASVLAADPRSRDLLMSLPSSDQLRIASSMDLGLLLAGIAKAQQFDATLHSNAVACIRAVREEALARYCPRAGLFRATSRGRRENLLYGRLTSFASQVYLLHGFAEMHRHLEDDLPRECPTVGERLVERQGSLGQWWWLYSFNDGRTIEGYPVYAVHQDAMALMALAPLHTLGQGEFDRAIARGLRWLGGDNELQDSLLSDKPAMVFRCVQRTGSAPDEVFGISRSNRARAVLGSLGVIPAPRHPVGADELEVLHECRSYHLGWALYAATLISGFALA